MYTYLRRTVVGTCLVPRDLSVLLPATDLVEAAPSRGIDGRDLQGRHRVKMHCQALYSVESLYFWGEGVSQGYKAGTNGPWPMALGPTNPAARKDSQKDSQLACPSPGGH